MWLAHILLLGELKAQFEIRDFRYEGFKSFFLSNSSVTDFYQEFCVQCFLMVLWERKLGPRMVLLVLH